VLCNLLENAAKYTPAGSHIIVAVQLLDEVIRISVTDNGPGLPKGMEQRIFDMFARGERESTTPGVGLGLAICRAIVEAHGGKITAENIPQGGARFVFTLPTGEPPALPEHDEAATAEF
jgi:two-component system sensor histidine kinase KdpD